MLVDSNVSRNGRVDRQVVSDIYLSTKVLHGPFIFFFTFFADLETFIAHTVKVLIFRQIKLN